MLDTVVRFVAEMMQSHTKLPWLQTPKRVARRDAQLSQVRGSVAAIWSSVQVLEQVQGQHAKGKKLRILFDDGENIGSDDLMRATYGGPRIRTDPVVFHFFKYGELMYKQALTHGFYASFGDFPEVAEKNELPPLTELVERCSVLEGREVILIDTQIDGDLRQFLDGPVVEAASAAGEVLMDRVQRVAVLVATRLGGAMADSALGAQYSTYSQSLQHKQGSTVLLLGSLTVGTSCHRALLAKVALLRVGIASAIRPASSSRTDGVAPPKQLFWQKEISVEYAVNITDRPGELTQVSGQAPEPTRPYPPLPSAQATPPLPQQAGLPTALPTTVLHATPPGSPRMPYGSAHNAAVSAAAAAVATGTPGQPVGIYDTSLVETSRYGSASTQPALSRGASATSMVTDAGPRGVPGGVQMPADLGAQFDGDAGAALDATNSSLTGLRTRRASDSPRGGSSLPLDAFHQGGTMTPPRSMSPTPTTFINRLPNPFAPGPAEAAAAATPAGSALSAGSGLSTQASVNASAQPMLAEAGGATGSSVATTYISAHGHDLQPGFVAWPFSNPEILSIAVRLQRGAGNSGGRRRGAGGNSAGTLSTTATTDDMHHMQQQSDRQRDKERERVSNDAVLWMSTGSSTGAGGGLNGSFLGADTGAGNLQSGLGGAASSSARHGSHTQLASGLGKLQAVESSSQYHLQHPDGATPGNASLSMQELSPPSMPHNTAHSSPALADYSTPAPPSHSASVPALPQSSPAGGPASGSRRRHRHRLASAFEGSGELRGGAAEAFRNIPQPRVSPSRPPIPPARSGVSAHTVPTPHGSPGHDTPLDAWLSGSAAARLSDLDLRPDSGPAGGALDARSDEMAVWWHGSTQQHATAADTRRRAGSDSAVRGADRAAGGGDIDGAGLFEPAQATVFAGSSTLAVRLSAKGSFADSGGNGSDTDVNEGASGAVQKFPPIPEAPERWGIGVVTALASGFGGDDESDGADETSAGGGPSASWGTFRSPSRRPRPSAGDSEGSGNLDGTSMPGRHAASTPTRSRNSLSAVVQDGVDGGGPHGRSGGGPAAGFASIFKGAFDSESEGLSPRGDSAGGSATAQPPQRSNGRFRGPQGDDECTTLASAPSLRSDSTNSKSGVRPYAGRLLSPFGEDGAEEESEEEPAAAGSGSAGASDGLGMLQPLSGAFGGGLATPLASPFADNEPGTSSEVSIHSNHIPPVRGAGVGSASLTPPRSYTPTWNSAEASAAGPPSGPRAGSSSSRGGAGPDDSKASLVLPPQPQWPPAAAAVDVDEDSEGEARSMWHAGPGSEFLSSSGRPGGGHVDMSGAISLDHNSTALPSAEANLRALVQNTSIHTLEAQFRMWINTSDITMTDTVIGRGSYGQVMLAKFRTERCAVKQIACETKAEYRAAMQEMLLMQELQFDKIVRFFGAIKRGRGMLWMCMEYMPFSDLRKILHNAEHRRSVRFAESMLSLPRRLKWAKDVVAALDLLHSRAVVHRDLKPGNVLISNKGDAVLSDFGLSRVREAQQSRLQASGPGTVSYAAPEALQANQVSPASDMFSFGCVLWELLSMKEPWAELHGATFQIMSKICHERASLRVEDIAEDVRELVPNVISELRKCLSFDPEQRPSAEHVYGVLDDAIESL